MAETVAEIAARYGATAPAGLTVTVVPGGQTSHAGYVWDGGKNTLVAVDPGAARAAMRRKASADVARRRGKRAAQEARHAQMMVERRERVRILHARGLTVFDMVMQGIGADATVRGDLRALGLEPHRISAPAQQEIRQLVAEGLGAAEIAQRTGRTVTEVLRIARRAGVCLVTSPRGRGESSAKRVRRAQIEARRAVVRRLVAEGHGWDAVLARSGITARELGADLQVLGLDLVRPGNAERLRQSRRRRNQLVGQHREHQIVRITARRAEIRAMLAADDGLTQKQIAAHLGVSTSVVADDFHALGIAGRRPPGPRGTIVALRGEIRAMREAGHSIAAIAGMLGVSSSGVQRVLAADPVVMP